MIFKVQDSINRTIGNLYTLSNINLRYLSEIEKDDIISECMKLVDGLYTNVCSEFDESIIEITKRCSLSVNSLKFNTEKLRNRSLHSELDSSKFKKLKYLLSSKDIRDYYNKKVSKISVSELANSTIFELYLRDSREEIKDLDANILIKNYDIYNINEAISSLQTSELLVADDTLNIIPYLVKVYTEYSLIIKWCSDINEATYQKLNEYKQYLERDITYKIKNNQCRFIESCTSMVYGILFFSYVYILIETIIKFQLNVMLMSVDALNNLLITEYLN